jgi:hypothetical protein
MVIGSANRTCRDLLLIDDPQQGQKKMLDGFLRGNQSSSSVGIIVKENEMFLLKSRKRPR